MQNSIFINEPLHLNGNNLNGNIQQFFRFNPIYIDLEYKRNKIIFSFQNIYNI